MGTGAGRSTEEEKRAITVSRELEDERRKEEEKWNKEQEKQAERELKEAEERQKKEEARLRIYNIEMITPYLSSPLLRINEVFDGLLSCVETCAFVNDMLAIGKILQKLQDCSAKGAPSAHALTSCNSANNFCDFARVVVPMQK